MTDLIKPVRLTQFSVKVRLLDGECIEPFGEGEDSRVALFRFYANVIVAGKQDIRRSAEVKVPFGDEWVKSRGLDPDKFCRLYFGYNELEMETNVADMLGYFQELLIQGMPEVYAINRIIDRMVQTTVKAIVDGLFQEVTEGSYAYERYRRIA